MGKQSSPSSEFPRTGCGKTTVIFNLLLQPGWLKSPRQQEYKVLRKGLDAGLSKQHISNLFKSQDYLGIPTTSAYRLPRHTDYLGIPTTSAYRLPRHTDYLGIPTTSAYRLPRHTDYLGIPTTSAYRYLDYLGIPTTSAYRLPRHTDYLGIPTTDYLHINRLQENLHIQTLLSCSHK